MSNEYGTAATIGTSSPYAKTHNSVK